MTNKNKLGALKSLGVAGFVGLCSVSVSNGAVILTLYEIDATTVGLDVSGSFNTAGLTPQAPSNVAWLAGGYLANSNIGFQENTPGPMDRYSFSSKVISGTPLTPNLTFGGFAGTGDFIMENGAIWVPTGYVSGDQLSATYTQSGSFASLGIVDGGSFTVTYTEAADSITFNTDANFSPLGVPEPSSALLASFGLGLLAFRRKRK